MTRSLVCFLALALAAVAQAGEPVARVRVAFDRNGVTAVHAEGLADVAANRAITADDPVRVASISKLGVAIAVMRLVEQGKLDLDADVSKQLGWTLRNPKWPDTPITLRLLLSHRSSLTDGAGYWQVPLDGQLKDLLDDPKAWDAEHAPGTYWRYTNLNFPLVAAVMERATGERFDLLMQRLVLKPLDLHACYGWPSCDEATAARAVVLYADGKPEVDDNQGHKPACGITKARDGSCDLSTWRAGASPGVFGPQGGLRISAKGLAKIGRLLLGEGKVDGVRLLKPSSVRTLIGPEWTFAPGNGVTIEEDDPIRNRKGQMCRYGLAVQTLATPNPDCGDDPFGDGIARVGHSGNAYGLLSGLWIDRKAGTGVAYFATGNDQPAPGERSAFTAVEEKLARGE
ncbi:beta-lactamase family protein [Pseudoxanthomonas helianthi]|uniref:Beta-lactamase family protein n=1 Tax=Pseudoxanthomonas helianthi TaxID=1453541 RepID=A0A940X3H2_9GAMM|nr:serine hydrolase domain-containing protein [Pseudoxanthomonas helianthi]MBP3984019.1 beta-lactamase family protein [Pseudoxanthomonas helianthi]